MKKRWDLQSDFYLISEKTEYFCVWYDICDSFYIWMLVVAVEFNPKAMTSGTAL